MILYSRNPKILQKKKKKKNWRSFEIIQHKNILSKLTKIVQKQKPKNKKEKNEHDTERNI
jgi:hypothetical protein